MVPPLFLGRCLASLRVLGILTGPVLDIFALFAFAVCAALESSLKALAIFLLAVRFLTVAALRMLGEVNLGLEGPRVAVHQRQHGVISLIFISDQIVAAHAVTPLPAYLIIPKAVTVEFQALGFFAVAKYSFLIGDAACDHCWDLGRFLLSFL